MDLRERIERERERGYKDDSKSRGNSYLVSGKSAIYWIQFLIFKLKEFTKLGMMISRDDGRPEEGCSRIKTFLL